MIALLRLPDLIVEGIIQNMDYEELFHLSILSNRTRFVIEHLYPRNKAHLKVHISVSHLTVDMGSFRLTCSDRYYGVQGVERRCKIGKEKMTMTYGHEQADLYYQCDPIYHQWYKEKHFRNVFQFVIRLFRQPMVSIAFADGHRREFALELLQYIKEQKLTLKIVDYTRCMPNFPVDQTLDQFTEMMNICGSASQLHLDTNPMWGYLYRAPTPKFFQLDVLKIKKSDTWFNLTDFMQCKKVSIAVGKHRYTSWYINWFIEKMLTEDCRLETFELLYGPRLHFPTVIKGLGDMRIESNYPEPSIVVENVKGRECRISQGQYHLKVELLEEKVN